MRFALLAGLVLAFMPKIASGDDACLRGDRMDHIKMVDPRTAVAGSLDGGKYRITFVTPCGARHIGTFFISNPDHLPTCIGPGTALQTNLEGVCTVKTIARF